MMKHTSRNILPAASTLPSIQPHAESSTTRIKKRQSVQRACNACRKIKCKCDGVRPVCAKCIERRTDCVYDTKEGMTRNASLRDANESLQAKIERYKEVFEGLIDGDPTVATRDHIRTLGLSPRNSNGTRSSTGGFSQMDTGPVFGNDSLPDQDSPSDNDSASHPGRNPFPEQNGRLGSEPFPSHDPHMEWLSTGFDPNDGRISGKQEGWHPILVVRQSQEIQSSSRTNESRDGEFWQPYRKPQVNHLSPSDYASASTIPLNQPLNQCIQGPYVYGHPGVDGDNMDIYHLQPDHRSQNLPTSTWQYHDSNGPSLQTSPFSPPPGAVTAYGNLPMSSAILANGYPPSTQRRQLLNFRVPEHTIPPLVVEENSDMSRLYVGFKDAALELIGNGASAPEILGDSDIVCVDLFIRDRVPGDPYTVCSWACELIKHLPKFDMFVQLAWIALLARFMRWIIHPTADNYARVPSMIRPIKVQRLIPHSPALDLCPHPAFREALMHHYRDWITPSQVENGGLTCWTKDLDLAVVMCPDTGCMILTTEFEKETQIRDSWTMSHEILSTFPDASKFGVKMRDTPLDNTNSNGKRWEDSQAFGMQGVSNGVGGEVRAEARRQRSQGSRSSTDRMSKMDIDEVEIRNGINLQESITDEQKRLRLAKLSPM